MHSKGSMKVYEEEADSFNVAAELIFTTGKFMYMDISWSAGCRVLGQQMYAGFQIGKNYKREIIESWKTYSRGKRRLKQLNHLDIFRQTFSLGPHEVGNHVCFCNSECSGTIGTESKSLPESFMAKHFYE
jgi:hypothetical protein